MFWFSYTKKIEFNHLKKYLKGLTPEKTLDLACGNGWITNKITKFIPGKFYGIDLDKNQIQKAQRNYSHIEFKVADAAKIPYEKNMFDLVCSNSSLEHIKNDKECFSEVRRVLKPGGFFVATTETCSSAILSPQKIAKREKMMCIENFYTLEKIQKRLKGFRVLAYEYYLCGASCRLNNFIALNKFPKFMNIGIGSPLHRLISPLLYTLPHFHKEDPTQCEGMVFIAQKE